MGRLDNPAYFYIMKLKQWRGNIPSKTLMDKSRFFSFRDNPFVDPSTITRTMQGIPQRPEGRRNLYTLIGAIHAVNPLSSLEVYEFFDKCEIDLRFDSLSKETFWHAIEEGVEKIKQPSLIENYANSFKQDGLNQVPVLKRTRKRYIYFSLIIIGLIIFIGLQLVNATYPSISSVCSEPIQNASQNFLQDQGFTQYLPNPGNPVGGVLSPIIRSIGINSQGVWVGYGSRDNTVEAISVFDGQVWSHCGNLSLNIGQNVNSFAFQNASVFVATDGSGILELQNRQGWRRYTTNEGLPSNSVYSLYFDGELLATTYEGVALLQDDHWETIYQLPQAQLSSNHIHTILKDSLNNYWFGSIGEGISRLHPNNSWTTYYTSTLGTQNVRNMTTDLLGGIWIATDGGGVLRHYQDNWTEFTANETELPSNHAHDVERDYLGRIWVATDQGLVYTSDLGSTWQLHSNMAVQDIELGTQNSNIYNEHHIWLALKDNGLGHVRIPPLNSTLRIKSIEPLRILHPGEEFIFVVEVEVLAEQLTPDDGDALLSFDPNGTNLFGAYPVVPVTRLVTVGDTYSFTNAADPITAPEQTGRYQLYWRVWQGRRYVSEPILIEFEVQ